MKQCSAFLLALTFLATGIHSSLSAEPPANSPAAKESDAPKKADEPKSPETAKEAPKKAPAASKVDVIRAQTTLASIVIACAQFETDYDRLPIPKSAPKGADAVCDSGVKEGVVSALKGMDIEQNPKVIDYLSALPEAKITKDKLRAGGLHKETDKTVALYDPWGHPYHIALDLDGDRSIADPTAKKDAKAPGIKKSAIAWSAGPDGKLETWDDNICSWKD